MYDQLPPGSYPKSIYISPSLSFKEANNLMESNGFIYPFAVKPDVGMMGFMFRKIETEEQFRKYHETMPFTYILQDFIHYPLEVSVFYYRFPNKQKGVITGFLRKEYLEVEGDGKSTLWELINNYPRVMFRLEEMKMKHVHHLNDILQPGEKFCLSPALNLSQGGKLVSLAAEKDERLLKVFDELSHYTKSFYYGRYDIKCLSVESLKEGRNFMILEYNGSGAEPHHVYGDGNTLFKACKILVQHWDVLFKISKYNHHTGIPYWGFKEGLKLAVEANRYFKTLGQLDAEFEL